MRENRGAAAMAVSAPLAPSIITLERTSLSSASIAASRANVVFHQPPPPRVEARVDPVDNDVFALTATTPLASNSSSAALISPQSTASSASSNVSSSSSSSGVFSGADPGGRAVDSDADPNSPDSGKDSRGRLRNPSPRSLGETYFGFFWPKR